MRFYFYLRVLFLKAFLLFSGFVFSPSLSAKIHIEPYVGFSGTFVNPKPIDKGTLNETGKAILYLSEGRIYSGLSSGMRVGYSSLGLAVGLDMNLGYWRSMYKEKFTPFHGEEIIVPILPGIFVSYKLPLFFRAYATFIPKAHVQFKNQKGDSQNCNRSMGAKMGVSYLSLPFLSVNFEYMPLYIGGGGCRVWSHSGTVYANIIF